MVKISLSRTSNLLKILSYLHKKTLRRMAWFNALTCRERVLITLILKNIKIVKNSTLAMVISRMIIKLILADKDPFNNKIVKAGCTIAKSWISGASSMGWEFTNWIDDTDILRWFGMFVYNTSRKLLEIKTYIEV